MLTRLRVSGFKNLVDVDVRFGPFTCIAGVNGVGKSNLFDAITFLSHLATQPFQEAARLVRDNQSGPNLKSLFTRTAEEYVSRMTFEAEMIIPSQGIDDLGQHAKASTTFLHYRISLGYKESTDMGAIDRLVLLEEELFHINRSDADKRLGFTHSKQWLNSIVKGRRTVPFISSAPGPAGLGETVIRRHQEKGGPPVEYKATGLTRTILSASSSAINAATASLVRQEMQSWQLLQLEPSALRRSDSFSTRGKLGSDGSHLPATIYRLARQDGEAQEAIHYAQISNRLTQFNPDVRRVRIDRDDKREILALEVEDRSGTRHSASALSDGTLRCLALTVIEQDRESNTVLCLEEPENGIHPALIPTMLDLLQNVAIDTTVAAGPDNPLQQVIITTHSPVVVQSVPQDCLIIADRVISRAGDNQQRISVVRFSAVPDTWRVQNDSNTSAIQLGKLLDYLNPGPATSIDSSSFPDAETHSTHPERLIDRADIQQLSLFPVAGPTPEPHAA